MNKKSRSARIVSVSLAAAAVLGAAALGTAQAAQTSPTASTASTAPTDSGIPTSVDAATGLASQGSGAGADSIYVTSQVKARGHVFGILVQTVNAADADQRIMTVAVTDETTGWYKDYQSPIAKNDYSWSSTGLDIKMPGLTWTGDDKHMAIQASTPWGALDLNFEAKGPVLNYAGTGEWQLSGSTQHEFALPNLRTTGALTVEGRTSEVSGEGWLDRQWGELPQTGADRWTWMNLSLSNGDRVAIWDAVGDTSENSWATVLHPDGSYELASVKPLADGASKTWTSPSSGNTYPTHWRIDIPSLRTHLDVHLTGTDDQELAFGRSGRIEGTAAASGIYEGKPVTGWNYVEMTGNWTS